MFGRPTRLLAAVCVADIFAGRGHRSRHVEHHRDAHAQISPGRGGRSTTPSSTNAPTMVVAEEYATKDWYGSVTKRYCKSGNTAPMQARSCRLPATDLIRAQDGDRQFGTGRQYQHRQYQPRQYQPRHRTGLRLIDAGQQPVVQRAGCDNAKAANITIYTVQINTGGIRLRSCCNIAPAVRTSSISSPAPAKTFVGGQCDRTVAGQAARRKITVEARQEFERQEKRQEKARPQRPGFFIVEVPDRERISARPG